MYAQRENKFISRRLNKNIEKLSSGMRINRAADDAANLAVSEKMRSQIRGLHQAGKNTQDGISFIQTVEGNLIETTNILQRMRELAIQSANGVYTRQDREQIQVEVSQLIDEVDRIAQTAQFNTLKMLEGQFGKRADARSMKTSVTEFT
jgi:flagellin